ncbi:MAG: hypothetical protein V2A67_01230 [Bacteroidota bacterium]
MKKLDKVVIGCVIGILVPLIAFTVFYFVRYSDLSLMEFLKVYKSLGILTHIVSLSVIPNLLVFFGFIQKNLLRGARGVLLATFIFTFTVIILRFT